MNRAAPEHVLRAAAAITGLDEFIVVGSQSILGLHPHAPDSLLVSDEVDLYPVADPENAASVVRKKHSIHGSVLALVFHGVLGCGTPEGGRSARRAAIDSFRDLAPANRAPHEEDR